MIKLTRLRQEQPFYLNPDLFERVDTYVDTVVRLRDGTEYIVVEPASEIIDRIIHYRASIVALANSMAVDPEARGFATTGTYVRDDEQSEIKTIEASTEDPSPWAPDFGLPPAERPTSSAHFGDAPRKDTP